MLFWISLSLFIGTLLGLLAMIGSWVYFDAKGRDEKPLTWMLIALFTPSLFGVLIYLLVGGKEHKASKDKFKIPLIVFAVSFIMSTGLFVGNVVLSDKLPIIKGVSIGMVNNNIGNKWSLSFKTSGEKLSKTVVLNENEIKIFTIDSKSEKGKVYLLVLQNDVSKVIDISNLSEKTIDLTEYKPGKIELMLYNDNAKDVSVNMTWGKQIQ